MAEENIEQDAGAVDLSGIGSFDFTPDWAKGKPDDKSRYARFEPRDERDDRPARGRAGARPSRDDDHSGKPRFSGGPRSGERNRFGDKDRFSGGSRSRATDDDRGPRREPRQFVKPLDAEVRILPNQKDLGGIIRKIQTSHLAYPMRQLERLFLENPGSCMLRVTPRGETAVTFHQCKACGAVAFSEDELAAHLLAAHLGDYWTSEEVECEPPKGAFTCVAKCGLSGELLGPPNLHGYDARIREMIRTRYPNMSEAAYRARIEIVHDQEAVEAWRQSATKKVVFKKKGEAEAPAVEREVAEMDFRMQIAPSLMSSPKAVDVPADQALKATDRAFLFACRDAFEFEKRRPRNLSFALHGAFHHRKLEFFRANDPRGPEFVVAVKPTPLDTAHAIPELATLVKFVEEHGETTRAEILAALAAGDEKKAAEIKSHIAWLVEKGHLIGFSDGVLTVPAKFPKHAQQRRAAGEGRAPARPEEPADAQERVPPAETAAKIDESDAINCVPPAEGSVSSAEGGVSGGAQLVAPENPSAPAPETPSATESVSQEEPKVEIQEEVKKDETADQLAE